MEAKTDAYFLSLHHRRVAGEILSGAEREELESFLAQRDAEEMKRLAPALARMTEQTATYEVYNERLAAILQRQERLNAHLAQVAEETRKEREAIRHDLERVMQTAPFIK